MPKPIKPKKLPPKNILNINFTNKANDFIDISKILRHPDVKNLIPDSADAKDLPMVVYNLTKPIRSKIFNHKKFVQELDIDIFLANPGIYPCTCNESDYKDRNHHHVISGDIRIITNNKLRKLVSMGPNYRESVPIDFESARTSIINGIEDCILKWSSKSNISKTCFSAWKDEIIAKLDTKIIRLKNRIRPRQVKQCLDDPLVKSNLEELHDMFVISPIDKATNNVAFICKRFYATTLLTEMGMIGNVSDTYEVIDKPPNEVIDSLTNDLKSNFKLKVNDENSCLPVAYWLPKMHKDPIGFRYIIASKKCTNKELSKHITSVFKLFNKAIESYHDIGKFHSGVNSFWVIQNNVPVIEAIEKVNKRSSAKTISTFDFSTLYTKIPHAKLIETLIEIIDFCFKCRTREKISINSYGEANWVTNTKNDTFFFTKTSLIEAVKFLINNCYFTIGNKVLRQIFGIPMGLDPAPYFANDFLYSCESKWLNKTKKSNNILARKFGKTFRFIDDLNALNDGGEFEKIFSEIYPPELVLKKENHNNNHATFLDLDITIINGRFETKLFDKRDDFPFSIVRFPYKCSNMPRKMFYSTIGAEFLRIARATSRIEDLIISLSSLIKRMLKQGAASDIAKKTLANVIRKHSNTFTKYNCDINETVEGLFV